MNQGTSDNVVVLDRDGTIVVDRGYLSDPEGLEFLPGAAAGLRLLHQQGYRLVVITNQSGVGRGILSVNRLRAIHVRLTAMAEAAGAHIEQIYYCPHRPEDHCLCRKPSVGLLLLASAELGFDPAKITVIGDKASDMELGQSVGATTLLISGSPPTQHGSASADHWAADLCQAASILERLRRRDVITPEAF